MLQSPTCYRRRPAARRWFTCGFSCLVFLVFATLPSCATYKRNQEQADLHMRLGTALLSNGNYPGALRELLAAEQLDPQSALIQNNLGLAYFLRDKPELAAKHLQRAVELAPNYSEARNNLGRVLIELTRYDQAIREIEKVTRDLTYQEPAKAWVNMGLAYFRKGDFATAREKFSEALRVNRNHCLAQTLFGRTLLEMGQLTMAAQALDNAVVICRANKYDEPHYYSGLTYYKLGKTSSAIARMEEVLKLYPHGLYATKAESLLKLMK